mmetsp:Transcript_56484/g.132488  ORF Transcript_56484/g.132488 Transcript_56484/m.132488 type:complete len:473 (+) Transcript_56484:64-1482(+)
MRAPIWGACPGAALAPQHSWTPAEQPQAERIRPASPGPARLLPQPLISPNVGSFGSRLPETSTRLIGPDSGAVAQTIGDRVAALLSEASQHSTAAAIVAAPSHCVSGCECISGRPETPQELLHSTLQWVPTFSSCASPQPARELEKEIAPSQKLQRRPGELRCASSSPCGALSAGITPSAESVRVAHSSRSAGKVKPVPQRALSWRPTLLPSEPEEKPPLAPWEMHRDGHLEFSQSSRVMPDSDQGTCLRGSQSTSQRGQRQMGRRRKQHKKKQRAAPDTAPSLRSLLVDVGPNSRQAHSTQAGPACPWQEGATPVVRRGRDARGRRQASSGSSSASPARAATPVHRQWLLNEQRRLTDMTLFMEAQKQSGRRLSGHSGVESSRRSVASASSTGIPSSSSSSHVSSRTGCQWRGFQDFSPGQAEMSAGSLHDAIAQRAFFNAEGAAGMSPRRPPAVGAGPLPPRSTPRRTGV